MELPASEFGDVILPAALPGRCLEPPPDRLRPQPRNRPRRRRHRLALARHPREEGQSVPRRRPRRSGPRPRSRHAVCHRRATGRRRPHDGRQTHFAAIVPSTSFGANPETPRRVVILLDHSGSMQGAPLTQARNAIEACLGVLTEEDEFGIVGFSSSAFSFSPKLQRATRDARDRARTFLSSIQAGGGTNRQRLPDCGRRAWPGGGDYRSDRRPGLRDRPDSRRRTAALASACTASVSVAPARTSFPLTLVRPGNRWHQPLRHPARTGRPCRRRSLRLHRTSARQRHPGRSKRRAATGIGRLHRYTLLLYGEGESPLEISWQGGSLRLPVQVRDAHIGETVRLLQGARLLTDAVAPRSVELSRKYGLACKMSLVAVVKRATDRPGELPETQVVPLGHGARRRTRSLRDAGRSHAGHDVRCPALSSAAQAQAARPYAQLMQNVTGWSAPPEPPKSTDDDLLVALAARIESDGGMPVPIPEHAPATRWSPCSPSPRTATPRLRASSAPMSRASSNSCARSPALIPAR